MMHDQERRLRRSNDPLVALHHQLSRVRAEAALEAVVVADGSGLVVAGAGAFATCEELAAFAPYLASGEDVGPCRDAATKQRVRVQSIDVGGERLLLCSTAKVDDGSPVPRAHALARAARGVERILRAA